MRLHLIRHGETETSGQTYAGRSDVALTDFGHEQARSVAQLLAEHPIGMILTSPLSRAVQTAQPLARQSGLLPIVLPALREIDFGIYEGRSKRTLDLSLRKAHARIPVPGGESLFDVWQRAGSVLTALDARHGEVAAVGHYWINRMIFGRANGMSFEETCRYRAYRPSTGSVVSLDPSVLGTDAETANS